MLYVAVRGFSGAVGLNFSKIVDSGGGDGLGFGTDAIAGSNGAGMEFCGHSRSARRPGSVASSISPGKSVSVAL